MDTATVELKPGTIVRVISIGGDLRLTGGDARRLEAKAGRRGGLRVTSRGEAVEITCESGCLIFLPSDCAVEVGAVGGDGRVTDLTGPLKTATVGGDLRLQRLHEVSIGNVGGGVLAQRVQGPFELKTVGGDARLERIEGPVHLGSVGGDLRAVGLEGSLEAHVGGDARVSLATRPGTQSTLQAGGDIFCRVPPGSSLHAELEAKGDLRVEGAGEVTRAMGSAALTLGAGEASLRAVAGGDLVLVVTAHADPTGWAGAITAEVEAALYEAEADLDTELEEGTVSAAGVGEQVRRALDRALRPVPPRERDKAEPGPGVDRERQMILAMLADRRITAEQAEALFRALEGDA
jgi:hypothetical protein